VLSSPFILEELARTLPRLSRRTGFTNADSRDFVDALSVQVDLVEPDEEVVAQAASAGLRDPADVPVLAACLAAQADYLITGDRDLLALAGRFPIITPADFCARYSP
jgi:putative PIN family toxin of toxin-antitoxin system